MMYKTLLLTEFIKALESTDEFSSAYIHKLTSELVEITAEASKMYEHVKVTGWDNYKPWEIESIKKVGEVTSDPLFIKIPNKFDINGYQMMEDFVFNIQNDILQDEFHHAIQGKGAFQRFKNKLSENGIENDWNEFKIGKLASFGRDWLRKNKIHFTDDVQK